jgi:hypothetical protein
MLLKPPSGDGYINVSTIYINSNGSNVEQGKDGSADFKVTLPNYLSDVVSLEVENYSVPINCLSQFMERNTLDFRLRNPDIFGGQWKTFQLVLPRTSFVYNTPSKRSTDLLSLLFSGFRDLILQDPDFGSKVDIVPIADPNTYVTLACRTLFYDSPTWPGFGTTECEFLFGTGASKSTSVAPILGFDEVDTAFVPLDYYGLQVRVITSAREASINLYRYMDVFIDEFSTTEPFYRVFVPSVQGIALTQPEVNARARLLEVPLRSSKTLTFHLRLRGGVKPVTDQPFYFNIKVFQLKTAVSVPPYDKNRAQYM